MASAKKQDAERSVSSERLAELLDKLVAVDLDLKPICKVGEEAPLVVVTADAIAQACDVLHSAITDVRSIIREVDGATYLPGEPSARRKLP
jgi:hypothetical protein